MDRRITFSLAAFVGMNMDVQALNLHGKVSNQSGKAIANAIVALTPQGLVDTTGTDGTYSITGGTSVLSSLNKGISFDNGVLEIVLGDESPVGVEIFDTRGHRVRSEAFQNAAAGVYRWDIGRVSQGTSVLLIKVSVGQDVATFRHVLLQGGNGLRNSTVGNVGGALARAAATSDSLKISASGYVSKTIAVPSLDATVDVTLDTLVSGLKNAAVPSSGCGKTPTLSSGSRTISSGGTSRSYMLRIPSDYDKSHPYPLVFAFHWNGGTMGDVDGGGTSGYTWSYYGLREKADKSTDSRMIFITPQGLGNGWANSNGQDLTLVDNLLKLAKDDLCVDTTRVFSMGFSYGGGMTYAIACARAGTFRAAAVYSGAQLSGCSDGTKPIAYIGVHGLRDPTCGIAGGRSLRDKFVKNNGCTAQNPPEPATNSLKHVCTTYSGCKTGYPVRWCAFDGAGHSPAPVDGSTSDYGGGDKTWTKDEVWSFFTQF
jgi:poly(3-hydroxybutyrate) depolymerase